MAAPIYIRLLGAPQVTSNGQPSHGFDSRKALALFCYLATRSEPHSRTHLADLFWGDKPEARGRGNLSRVLHNLNELFPGAFLATRDTLQLDPSSFILDLQEFETLTSDARDRAAMNEDTVRRLSSAVQLYRDEFMAGIYLDDCPDFELWLVAERERWRQRVITILDQLSHIHTESGEYDKALPYTARILDLEPWREEAHRQMMHLLAQTGQRSAALQQYETARRVLAEELNIAPAPETVALCEQIRAEHLSPAATPPNNLPTQLTTFFGRETDITRITARLNNPDCRLLTLVGAGGIGKTRLALEAAKNLIPSFRDGVFFVPLASIGVGHTDFIVPAIAHAVGFTFAGTREPQVQLLDFLRSKRILLLLDNFEHLLEARELLIEILQDAPHVKILDTSREPLNLRAEWVSRIQGLTYPTLLPSGSMDLIHYSAVRLFAERARRVSEEFELNDKTAPPIIRICQAVEGMPLALELAAASTKWLPIQDIALQIENNLDVLTTPQHDMESRHQSLRAVLDWSYGLLSEAEQTLFRRLSVFAGGWTLEAAEQVCAGQELQAGQVFNILTQLVDKSLVLKEVQEQESRHRFLEPVRQYAHESLLSLGEASPTQTKHLSFYSKFTERAEPRLRTADQEMWLEALEIELENVRAALQWSLQSSSAQARLGLGMAGNLWWFWMVRYKWNEGVDWLSRLLSLPENSTETFPRAKALYGAGFLEDHRKNYSQARNCFEESLMSYGELADRRGIADALFGLGMLARHEGSFETARALLEESLAKRRELRDSQGIADTLVNLGHMALRQRDWAQARAMYSESLILRRDIGDNQGIADSLGSLGWAALQQGDLNAARTHLEEGLPMFQNSGHERGADWLLDSLGDVTRCQGDYKLAEAFYVRSLALWEKLGINSDIPYTLNSLGSTALHQDDFQRAMGFFCESLRQFRKFDDEEGTALCLVGFARLALAQGKSLRAVQLLGVARLLDDGFPSDLDYANKIEYESIVSTLNPQIDDATSAYAWAEERAMRVQQAIAYALQDDSVPSDSSPATSSAQPIIKAHHS